ncbi:neprilysin-4-like [Anastrepha ludens]|uniref:neprilysin-4-like n=1 Tax=Anastrepha ludens TaxID=28586 RepID=UPI0023B0537A|nr:neprilysin-4-like [Anastrepha ludens]
MPFSSARRAFSQWFFWLLLLLGAYETELASVPQVQLHEQKISQANNTDYVRDVMRQAKSAEMRNYMQAEADACDDFFKYACGTWEKINPTDVHNVLETNFFALLLSTYNQKQLKVLLEVPQRHDDEVTAKVKTFFGACRQFVDKPNERYKLELWEIAEEFGQMPALMPEGTWEASEFDWSATIGRIQNKYGLDVILQLSMREDFVNNSVHKLFIGQPALALQSRAMYKSPATKWYRDKYEKEIEQALQRYLGINEAVAKQTAREILYFESRLADGMLDKQLGKTLKSMAVLRTVDEMQAAYEGVIDVRAYLNISLGQEFNETFYEYHVEYQRNLVQMLKEIPKAQVANYILYQLLKTFFFDYNATNGVKEKLCLDKTKLYFSKVLDNIIFRKYNNEKTIADINGIWLKIKEIFKEELETDSLNWISAITRKVALDKLDAMRLDINTHEISEFTEEFANLTLSQTDYIGNLKKVLAHKTKHTWTVFRHTSEPLEMPTALSLSPTYSTKENLIRIPVMLLQPYFLWSDYYPNALKFGTLGYLVAHELIHGFDDVGRNFDATGNEQSWWDNNSTEAFAERKKCFKRQYSLFRYNGKYLPQSELQAENIADNGGIQLAYKAYQKWLTGLNESTSEEHEQLLALETLPSLSLTNHQLFFLAFAQYWCNDVDAFYRDKVSLLSTHAPAKYRVIGSLANFPTFAEEFQCASGTTMNPKQKCKIY